MYLSNIVSSNTQKQKALRHKIRLYTIVYGVFSLAISETYAAVASFYTPPVNEVTLSGDVRTFITENIVGTLDDIATNLTIDIYDDGAPSFASLNYDTGGPSTALWWAYSNSSTFANSVTTPVSLSADVNDMVLQTPPDGADTQTIKIANSGTPVWVYSLDFSGIVLGQASNTATLIDTSAPAVVTPITAYTVDANGALAVTDGTNTATVPFDFTGVSAANLITAVQSLHNHLPDTTFRSSKETATTTTLSIILPRA